MAVGTLKVTQVKSSIGTKPKHRGTLRALGLRGIGQSNELPGPPRDPRHDRPRPPPDQGGGGLLMKLHDLTPPEGLDPRQA